MSELFFKAKTTDYTEVRIRKDHVSAVEEIPSKGGAEPSVKLYVNGYSFKLRGEKDDFLKILGIPIEAENE